MSTALIITDKKTNNIVHTIVCKDEDSVSKYIMKDDPKLNYQIVPNYSSPSPRPPSRSQETYFLLDNPEPSSMWLVIVECRFNVVRVCASGEGFYIPGQEPCWSFDHVDTWVRQIIPTHAEMNACDISDIPSQTH